MIRAYFKKQTIVATVEKKLTDYELKFDSVERLAERMANSVAAELDQLVWNSVQKKFDETIIDKLAQEYLNSFDFKKAIEEALHHKIRNFVRGNLQ